MKAGIENIVLDDASLIITSTGTLVPGFEPENIVTASTREKWMEEEPTTTLTIENLPVKDFDITNWDQSVGDAQIVATLPYEQAYSGDYGNGVILYIAPNGIDLYKSIDDGFTYKTIANAFPFPLGALSIAYGNGVWLAITDSGVTIYKSIDDGETWGTVTLPESNYLLCLKYGNGVWLIGCTLDAGTHTILRSTDDGDNWTGIDPNAGTISIESMDFGSSVWIISDLGYGSGTFKSIDDGANWSICSANYGGIKYVTTNIWIMDYQSLGADGGIQRSIDNGATWVFVHVLNYTSVQYFKICGIGTGIIFGYYHTFPFSTYDVSTDNGATWIKYALPCVLNSMSVITIIKAATQYLLNIPSSEGIRYYISVDGYNFTNYIGIHLEYYRMAYGNNYWIGIADSGTYQKYIFRSADDGLTWEAILFPDDSGLYGIDYGNGVWIVTTETSIYTSIDDGDNWTLSYTFLTAPINSFWRSIKYSNGTWIVINNKGANTSQQILRSTNDGLSWTIPVSSELDTWYDVSADGAGVWVAVATSGTNRIMRSSDDGLTWGTITPPEINDFRSIDYGSDGVWVIVSFDGTHRILRSDDNGATWSYITSPAQNLWHRVRYGLGIWIAIPTNNGESFMKSLDNGLTWELITPINMINVYVCLAYGNNRFIVSSGYYAPTNDYQIAYVDVNISNYDMIAFFDLVFEDTLTLNTYDENSVLLETFTYTNADISGWKSKNIFCEIDPTVYVDKVELVFFGGSQLFDVSLGAFWMGDVIDFGDLEAIKPADIDHGVTTLSRDNTPEEREEYKSSEFDVILKKENDFEALQDNMRLLLDVGFGVARPWIIDNSIYRNPYMFYGIMDSGKVQYDLIFMPDSTGNYKAQCTIGLKEVS